MSIVDDVYNEVKADLERLCPKKFGNYPPAEVTKKSDIPADEILKTAGMCTDNGTFFYRMCDYTYGEVRHMNDILFEAGYIHEVDYDKVQVGWAAHPTLK